MIGSWRTLVAALVMGLGAIVNSQELEMDALPLRTHSIYAPYVDQDLQNRWYSFGGDAYVNTNKHIRLTQDRRSETGWLWSRLPLSVPNYQVEVEFKIAGTGGHLFGDGMAFWFTSTRAEFGPVFGSRDRFEGVGVFIDTYANSRHSYSFPRVMGMIGDGFKSYDLGNDGAPNEAGACSASLRKLDIKTKIRMTYIKGVTFSVDLQYKAWDEWTPCFEIKNMTLPATPYFGVTAVTGDVHDAHDVISISANSLSRKTMPAPGDLPSKRKKGLGANSGSGSWSWTFLKLILFGGVCAGAFQGWKMYNERGGRWSNKRF